MPSVNAESSPRDSGGDSAAAGPVTAATDRLIATAAGFDDSALAHPSLCPGWTRAHVLTHVARNADALTNLLTWARTGKETLMYPSAEARDAAIEAGAGRTAGELVDDVRMSADRFSKAVMDMPDDGWERLVRPGAGGRKDPVPGRRALWLRLLEVELHHVDLAAGYGPGDWPRPFVQRALDETLRSFARREDVPPITVRAEGKGAEHVGSGQGPTVSGPAAPLLAWLTGRSSGAGLRVEPAGPLPPLPPWS